MFKKILLVACLSFVVVPVNLNANAFSFARNSYLRKSLRIIGGVGAITLFAERMIIYNKGEREFNMLDALISFYCCYTGFKILSQDL